MKARRGCFIFLLLTMVACEPDPARFVRIIPRPATAKPTVEPSMPAPEAGAPTPARPGTGAAVAGRAAGTTRTADREQEAVRPAWQPVACKKMNEPQGDAAGFRISGPCPYQLKHEVACRAAGDDLYVFIKQELPHQAEFSVMLNVEHYKGPGVYDLARMFVLLHEGTAGYRWSSTDVHVTVGPGESFVVLPPTDLFGEPARHPCARLGGQRWDYRYRCEASNGPITAIESTIEKVSGKISCLSAPKEER